MTLPLMRAAVGAARGCRFPGVAIPQVVLALGLGSGRGLSEEADPFSATVTVDATADTVVNARDAARIDGQRRALAAVAEQLSGGAVPAKLAKLDDKMITDLVASFEVAHERMSTVLQSLITRSISGPRKSAAPSEMPESRSPTNPVSR